jgi:hypothetical protein
MAKLTSKQRKALPAKAFAGPDRSYPINDANHARNALSRAAQNASPALQSKIKAKVKSRYPGIAVGGNLSDLTK